ncbi:unnamed protein product [Amoebophrya sp. A120]|nr:unnamed protein product [Amoebophrya sp. A120]|eukprot:GSA120T00008015001.1
MRVFLEFSVGDLTVYNQELKEFTQFADFVKQRGATFGCPTDAKELDEEQKEMLAEVMRGEVTDSTTIVRTTEPVSPKIGQVKIDLNDKECPKTAENFRALCTGEKGIGKGHQKPLHFLNSTMHRIVPNMFLHGGDFTRFDGSGGDSIYSGKFNDEKPGLKFKHDVPGLLSMANSGKNSNTSQFFLTLGACPKLDGKHVVFGKVADEESLSVLKEVALKCEPDAAKEMPGKTVTITGCGVV